MKVVEAKFKRNGKDSSHNRHWTQESPHQTTLRIYAYVDSRSLNKHLERESTESY